MQTKYGGMIDISDTAVSLAVQAPQITHYQCGLLVVELSRYAADSNSQL